MILLFQKYSILVCSYCFSFLLLACKPGSEIKTDALLKVDNCAKDSTHKYSVYIPQSSAGCKILPLIIILDPHGSGSYVINNFITCAENYKCILAASHLVRNNYGGFIQAIEVLINDVKFKYPIGDRIYLAGFSGGARMALTFAQGRGVKGILACGALSSHDQITSLACNVFAITGLADFNFPEVASYILNEAEIPSNLRIELAGDLHEWPSSQHISRAMGNLLLADIIKDKCINKNEILKNYSGNNKHYADSLYQESMLLNTGMVCRNVLTTQGLPDRLYFKNLQESVNSDVRMKEQLSKLRKSLQFEFKVRDAYYNALKVRDIKWWSDELADLDIHIHSTTDPFMQYAYRRIKAFLGIICYSITHNALRNDDLTTTVKTLEIYKLVEPDNPDMYYFSALYALKAGNNNLIRSYLKLAVENGFGDLNILKNEFPSEYLKVIIVD